MRPTSKRGVKRTLARAARAVGLREEEAQESVDEAVIKRKKALDAIYKRFPRGNKGRVGGKRQVMLTGPIARTMGKDNYARLTLDDLTNAEVEKLARACKAMKPEDELAEYMPQRG